MNCGGSSFFVKRLGESQRRHPYYFVCVECQVPHEVGQLVDDKSNKR